LENAVRIPSPLTAVVRRGSELADIEGDADFKSFFDNAVEGIYRTTADGRYLRANPALARIYGYDSPNDLIGGLTDIAGQLYVDSGRRNAFTDIMARHDVVRNFEARVFRRDGSIIWITENARAVRDPFGGIRYYEGTVEDITERKEQEEKIRLLAMVFDSVADGILIVDPDLNVKAVNPAYTIITGRGGGEVTGRPLALFAPGAHDRAFVEHIWLTTKSVGGWQGEVTSVRANGDAFAATLAVTAVRSPLGALEHYVLVLADISQRKFQEHQIRYQASFDRLTDLPNRWLVCERLEDAISRAQRAKTKVAVAFIDLNRFKLVNDTLGHQAGDDLLKLVAKRLRSCTRVSDTIGRLGGDEFLIVAPDAADTGAGVRLADKVLYALSDPFLVHNNELFCRASIGVAFYPDDGETADQLLRNADMAMYNAKRNPERRFAFYDPGMREQNGLHLNLENDLRRAIGGGEFEMFYQPKIDLVTQQVFGAEALIRWRHPTRGMVSPGEFIPLAEETGLIWELGCWTMGEACRQLAAWTADGLELDNVSVNLSPRQFQDTRLVSQIREVIEQSGVDVGKVELELTESAMIGDIENAVTVLNELKALGLRLSIDDFGTGYSSMAYLKRFPIDTLKIDRSFVRDIETSVTDPAIVGAIVTLAESLGFEIIAEGVETQQQALVLQEQRCRSVQGFLYSPPIPAKAFEEYVRRRRGLI
jgi:diguanylate cyclase (GGDEF)-like protein/PAS domain S-box-containing protein